MKSSIQKLLSGKNLDTNWSGKLENGITLPIDEWFFDTSPLVSVLSSIVWATKCNCIIMQCQAQQVCDVLSKKCFNFDLHAPTFTWMQVDWIFVDACWHFPEKVYSLTNSGYLDHLTFVCRKWFPRLGKTPIQSYINILWECDLEWYVGLNDVVYVAYQQKKISLLKWRMDEIFIFVSANSSHHVNHSPRKCLIVFLPVSRTSANFIACYYFVVPTAPLISPFKTHPYENESAQVRIKVSKAMQRMKELPDKP